MESMLLYYCFFHPKMIQCWCCEIFKCQARCKTITVTQNKPLEEQIELHLSDIIDMLLFLSLYLSLWAFIAFAQIEHSYFVSFTPEETATYITCPSVFLY